MTALWNPIQVGVGDLKSPTPKFSAHSAGLPGRPVLLLVVDVDVLGVDHAFVFFGFFG